MAKDGRLLLTESKQNLRALWSGVEPAQTLVHTRLWGHRYGGLPQGLWGKHQPWRSPTCSQ